MQGSRSQLEMNYPSYRSHPLHHTNTYGSLEKVRRLITGNSADVNVSRRDAWLSLQSWQVLLELGNIDCILSLECQWSDPLSQVERDFHFQWWSQQMNSWQGYRSWRRAVEESQYYLTQPVVTKGILYPISCTHQRLGVPSPYKSFRPVVFQEARQHSGSVSNKTNIFW